MEATYQDLPLCLLFRATQLADYRTLAMWARADRRIAEMPAVREELRRVSRVLADLRSQTRFSARFGVGCVTGDCRHPQSPWEGEEGGVALCLDPSRCSVCRLVIEADAPEFRICEEHTAPCSSSSAAAVSAAAAPPSVPPAGGPAASLRPVARFSSLIDLLGFVRTSRFADHSCLDPRLWGLVREPDYEQAVRKPGGAFVYRFKPHLAVNSGLVRAGPPVVPHKRWGESWGGFFDVDSTTEWMEESLENWLRFLLLPYYEEVPKKPSSAAAAGICTSASASSSSAGGAGELRQAPEAASGQQQQGSKAAAVVQQLLAAAHASSALKAAQEEE